MNIQDTSLYLKRCSYCNVANPNIITIYGPIQTTNFKNKGLYCRFYSCKSCAKVTIAYAHSNNGDVFEFTPEPKTISQVIPEPIFSYLTQALESIHSPAASIMVAASAVDAMLKHSGYKEGVLFTRIDKAKEDHLITEKMAEWAHKVRLDANAQRHVDENFSLPEPNDAADTLEFAQALAQYLFVLPAMIEKGLKPKKPETKE